MLWDKKCSKSYLVFVHAFLAAKVHLIFPWFLSLCNHSLVSLDRARFLSYIKYTKSLNFYSFHHAFLLYTPSFIYQIISAFVATKTTQIARILALFTCFLALCTHFYSYLIARAFLSKNTLKLSFFHRHFIICCNTSFLFNVSCAFFRHIKCTKSLDFYSFHHVFFRCTLIFIHRIIRAFLVTHQISCIPKLFGVKLSFFIHIWLCALSWSKDTLKLSYFKPILPCFWCNTLIFFTGLRRFFFG